MSAKIVLIGAGSAVFTAGLVRDLLSADDLGAWSLGLVDIQEEALQTAEGLCQRIAAAYGVELDIDASTDRRDVLPGADLVVTTIAVGGRRAWELDVRIPRQFGIYQPVGDTVMPGGISRAQRMIPALVDIARDVAALCPNARVFNYANPMTANCWAIRQATGVPVVGLCHGVHDTIRSLAMYLSLPPERVTATYAGLNHLTFIYDLRCDGDDQMPALLARARADSDIHSLANRNPFAFGLLKTYGAYPAVHDRHVTEFFPERFPGGRYDGRILGVDAYSFEDTIADGDQHYAAMKAQAAGRAPLDPALTRRTSGEHEQLVEIVQAMRRDAGAIYSANVPNRSAVANLPADAILELPCTATALGLRPLQLDDFPDVLAGIITRKLTATRLTVAAALAGDRRLFVEALLADGAITDPSTAGRLADALLAAHQEHLPQYA